MCLVWIQNLLAKSKALGSELEYPYPYPYPYPYILSTFESVPGFWTCNKTQDFPGLMLLCRFPGNNARRTKLGAYCEMVRGSKHRGVSLLLQYSSRVKQFLWCHLQANSELTAHCIYSYISKHGKVLVTLQVLYWTCFTWNRQIRIGLYIFCWIYRYIYMK